jgi:hypothetical protein
MLTSDPPKAPPVGSFLELPSDMKCPALNSARAGNLPRMVFFSSIFCTNTRRSKNLEPA